MTEMREYRGKIFPAPLHVGNLPPALLDIKFINGLLKLRFHLVFPFEDAIWI